MFREPKHSKIDANHARLREGRTSIAVHDMKKNTGEETNTSEGGRRQSRKAPGRQRGKGGKKRKAEARRKKRWEGTKSGRQREKKKHQCVTSPSRPWPGRSGRKM